MDFLAIEQQLEAGQSLKVKYRYPLESDSSTRGERYGVRTDKLVDVSPELRRVYTRFRGETPIWIEEDEVLEISPDDGVYSEFADEA